MTFIVVSQLEDNYLSQYGTCNVLCALNPICMESEAEQVHPKGPTGWSQAVPSSFDKYVVVEEMKKALVDKPKEKTKFADHNTLLLHAYPFLLSLENNDSHEGFDDGYSMNKARTKTKNTASTPEVLHCENIVLAVLLFHLGLSYHLNALHGSIRQKDVLMRNALDAYNIAEDVLQSTEIGLMTIEEQRVLLAIHNNMAHASFHFYDVVACSNHLVTLRYLLSFFGLTSQDETEGSLSINEDQQRSKHFFMNAIPLVQIFVLSPSA